MPRIRGQRLLKYVDSAASAVAGAAFDSIQFFNKYKPNPSFTPRWSEKPLLKSWQKSKPPLGWPRQTDSLCPECVREARAAIISGAKDWNDLLTECGAAPRTGLPTRAEPCEGDPISSPPGELDPNGQAYYTIT